MQTAIMSRVSTLSFLALSLVTLAAAQRHGIPPTDPFADPAHDVFNPLRYIASNGLSAMGVGEYKFCKSPSLLVRSH
jgi:hypothetical protein